MAIPVTPKVMTVVMVVGDAADDAEDARQVLSMITCPARHGQHWASAKALGLRGAQGFVPVQLKFQGL